MERTNEDGVAELVPERRGLPDAGIGGRDAPYGKLEKLGNKKGPAVAGPLVSSTATTGRAANRVQIAL